MEKDKAKQIRLLILDVDGILTSGILHYDAEGKELRDYHIHDGFGIKLLQEAGIPVAIISGKKSASIEKRAETLKIKYLYLGYSENKISAYEELKSKLQLKDAEIAYMGDDIIDFPLLKRAGLAISVPNAIPFIQQQADFITKNKGGKGAVREVCDLILIAQNKYESVIQSYLS